MKTKPFLLSKSDKSNSYTIAFLAVLFTYLIIYFLFLCHTNFMPYVFDNNETFSNLMHAQNLYNFGFKYTFGLTDEAFSMLKEGHPYVYTHQGNFPRLYSFILYCLKIRTAEWQIIISTFTIGLAGILLCYHFFAKYVSCLFSAIFCLLLMSDYIMFMQWQVNTWRVWHLFFFFSSFLCCHGLNGLNRKRSALFCILNFSCLFYMEISYATFVFLSSGIYLLFFPNNSYKRKIGNLLILSSGVFLGISILIAQNIAYLGWEVFSQDLSYTFSARNKLTSTNSDAIAQVTQFYSKHKIAFWENFNSVENIKSPLIMLKNFHRHCLLPYGPFLTLAALITMFGSLLSYFLTKVNLDLLINRLSIVLRAKHLSKSIILYAITTIFFINIIPSHYILRVSFSMIIFGIALYGFTYKMRQKNNIFFFFKHFKTIESQVAIAITVGFFFTLISLTINLYPATWSTQQRLIELARPVSLISILLICLLVYRITIKNLTTYKETKFVFLIPLVVYLLISSCISSIFFNLNTHSSTTAIAFLQTQTLTAFGGTAIVPLIMSIILMICAPFPFNIYASTTEIFKKLWPFLISTFVGFICTYFIFAGYINSGYWVRSCCFTVFAHMTLFAWLFYVFISFIFNFLKNDLFSKKISAVHVEDRICLSASCSLIFLFIYSWINFQQFYFKEFPAVDFNFIKLLSKWPLHNQTIVANAYGAPLSFMGKTWSYLDPAFGNSTLKNEDHLTSKNPSNLEHDLRYLWLADGLKNIAYLKPDLFICWQGYNFEQVGQLKPRCGDLPLIKSIRNQSNNTTGFVEVAEDQSGRDKWAIVKLGKGQLTSRIKIHLLAMRNIVLIANKITFHPVTKLKNHLSVVLDKNINSNVQQNNNASQNKINTIHIQSKVRTY